MGEQEIIGDLTLINMRQFAIQIASDHDDHVVQNTDDLIRNAAAIMAYLLTGDLPDAHIALEPQKR